MKFIFKKKLYFPALSIVAVVVGLLLVIGISTYRNIDREKHTQLNFVYRQGLILLRAIEAGARSGMAMPMWGTDSIAILLKETGKDESIEYIYLVDKQGKVAHHSIPLLDGSMAIWFPTISKKTDVVTQIRKKNDGSQIYDLAKLFSPSFDVVRNTMPHHMFFFHEHEETILVVGLSMRHFEAARKADVQHAFIMAAIVLTLGSGTFFFIFVIQNFYLVDRTLKQTRDYTRQVIANMANGLLGLDKNGKLISYNEVALTLLDLDESKLKDIEISRIIDFKGTGIRKTLESCEKVIETEFTYQTKTGQIIPLSISSTPIKSELGTCEGVVIIIRDLREIKALEKKIRETEKLATIGKLAASVAHEVRNPLSSIKGFAQFMHKTMDPGTQQKQYAQIMIKEVDRINRVINDLLTFSRSIKLDLNPTDVAKLIEHTISLVKADAESKNITIRIDSLPSIDQVLLDESQLTQVLLNLLLNAMSAIENKGVIEISSKFDSASHSLLIDVTDNGDGIKPEFIKTIFEPFVTTREKGTGIGLAIAKKIVENHEGQIIAQSPPVGRDKGSLFRIIIPIKS
jgi:two-component system sensor histidine kinase HydH